MTIRLAHGFEVGISNFLFGALVGWTLVKGRMFPSAARNREPWRKERKAEAAAGMRTFFAFFPATA